MAEQPRTRRPKNVTRLLILAKGFEMYLDGRLPPGDERLADVLTELGYTTGAGYQIWENQPEFREDLMIYIADNLAHRALAGHREELSETINVDDWRAAVLHLAETLTQIWAYDEETRFALRFYLLGDTRPDQVTQSLQERVRLGWDDLGWLFESLLERHRRCLAPDETMVDMCRAIDRTLVGEFATSTVIPGDRATIAVDGQDVSRLARDVAALIEIRTIEIQG